MNKTGMVRKIDRLGRLVVPKEIRDSHNIKEKDKFEILIDNKNIVLKKFETRCGLCEREQDLNKMIKIGDKYVCNKCIQKLKTKTI